MCEKQKEKENLLGIIVHNSRYAVNIKAVRLGRQSFSEPVRDVIRAQQARDHHKYVERDEAKDAYIPPFQNPTLKVQKVLFTPWQHGPRITRRTDGRLNERVVVTATLEFVLHA